MWIKLMAGILGLGILGTWTSVIGIFNETEDPSSIVMVDNFDDQTIEKLPDGWEGRKEQAKEEYKVKEVNGDRYLEVYNERSNMFIIKTMKVDLVEYPILNWKWKADEFDPSGNESEKDVCDNPASIAIVFRLSKWRPKSIKYTWSANLPVNTFTKSPYAKWPSRCDIVVIESGTEHVGQWMTVKRNVLRDYLALHQKSSVNKMEIEAIVLMSDSDNTKSVTRAAYDDIFFSVD